MTICIFCSANIPSDELDSHINNNHPFFFSSNKSKSNLNPSHTTNHSFISHNIWQSVHPTPHTINPIGNVFDDDILKPLVFLDGKRIKENIKKHKRNDISNHNRRPYKRRKLNDNKNKTKIKCKTKCKPKSKPKQKPSVEDYEIEEEGEEDPYGGLPYHFHLATHCE
eukprot:227746_1